MDKSIGCLIANGFEVNEGTRGYNGIVATIQKWYYGRIIKASWCATSLSFMASAAGLPLKEENVNLLRIACKAKALAGKGRFYDKRQLPATIKRGDICFWLFAGATMTNTSKKHVNVCVEDSTSDKISCIGGNQNDMICTKTYNRKQLYAVYRV